MSHYAVHPLYVRFTLNGCFHCVPRTAKPPHTKFEVLRRPDACDRFWNAQTLYKPFGQNMPGLFCARSWPALEPQLPSSHGQCHIISYTCRVMCIAEYKIFPCMFQCSTARYVVQRPLICGNTHYIEEQHRQYSSGTTENFTVHFRVCYQLFYNVRRYLD